MNKHPTKLRLSFFARGIAEEKRVACKCKHIWGHVKQCKKCSDFVKKEIKEKSLVSC